MSIFAAKFLQAVGQVGETALGVAAQHAVEKKAKAPGRRRRRKTECTPCAARARVLQAKATFGR